MTALDQHWNPHGVLITGASSGIGAALATALAAPGRRLDLGGRSADRLVAVAEGCSAAGAEVHTACLDLRDGEALRRWIGAIPPPDLLVANAGVSGHDTGSAEIVAVNVQAVIATVEAALPRMREGSRIALMSSLAGFNGMASAPVYCASKAAVRIYGDGLRARLRGAGIAVSIVCPGFVATPMTDSNPFPMPLMMSPEQAAGRILRGLARRQAVIAFPTRLYWLTRLFGLLPRPLADRISAHVPRKERSAAVP
ncbi:MAG TPA: SDR family NAD(P)-dependent oxidoreductase [Geminicoccaceae bacterium]|nr:SDR family NAD(P)-dependent oxidoreductase [Geminicoccus sp.]HMU51486.1 SDR family NAD(P)-dependent oxidoreductase [Geminicoccaceae bacterium]